jgi:GxxExxY protein
LVCMAISELQHADISRKVIGAAMTVHGYFGMGFPENIYSRALKIELESTGLDFRAELEKDIYYKGVFLGKRRLDLIVEGKILVELKAIHEVDKNSVNQMLNYLKVFGLEVGLLLNFGAERLYFKRFGLKNSHLRNPFHP